MNDAGATTAYAAYGAQLRQLTRDVTLRPRAEVETALNAALDGEAADQLRDLVALSYRREVGAFFTGATIRGVLAPLLTRYGNPPYLDPACGAGDLLLVAAATLPIQPTIDQTVRFWSELLAGVDIHPEFVDVARARLWLLAASMHSPTCSSGEDRPAKLGPQEFHGLHPGDGLQLLSALGSIGGTVVLNPPFGSQSAPLDCGWGSGLVPRAGVFVDHVSARLTPGARLVAVLPDVLRSGRRLERWRAMVESRLRVEHIDCVGRFDPHTNVDVFVMVGTRRNGTSADQPVAWWPSTAPEAEGTIGDRFEIRVGTVVDNRDAHEGSAQPFAVARNLPLTGQVRSIERERLYAGRVFKPPFVLIRRTSAPSRTSARARGLLVSGNRSVAVDNHLLVLSPRDGAIDSCEELLDVLQSTYTTQWLDARIRCRHLTVGAVAAVPWRTSSSAPI